MDIVLGSDDFYEFDDVAPMFIWALHCIPDEKEAELYRGLPKGGADDYKAVHACFAEDDSIADSEDYWRVPNEVAQGLRLLAQACKEGLPGAQMIWDQAREVFDPIEGTDGGRRIANADGVWDNAPDDWAGVCAEDLEGFAKLVEEMARRGETKVRLLIYDQ